MAEIKVTGVQLDAKIGCLVDNRNRAVDYIRREGGSGARLIVFPECALSGYVFDDPEEARAASEPIPGPSTELIVAACREAECYVVVGMLESEGEVLYNSAALCGPEGVVGVYRKTHLPFLGVDRMTRLGPGPYEVYETPLGRIGMLICYDLRFPEATRCLTLAGADILVLPTNWPEGAEASPNYTAPARAVENRIFVVAVNRAGIERGTRFIGKSQIVDPAGRRLAVAETTEETVIQARFDPLKAREKRLKIVPGVFEIDTVGDRRPELYGQLTRSS